MYVGWGQLSSMSNTNRNVRMARDISDAVLEGDAYEEADALTRRVFPISLSGKIRLSYVILLSATAFMPAFAFRTDLIRTVEPTASLTPALVDVAGLGVIITFLFGLAFVRQRVTISTRDFDFESAKQFIRFEDLLMTFAVSSGFLFVLAPLSLALVGLFSPDTVFWLYERDVQVYRPSTIAFTTTTSVSGLGAVLGVCLLLIDRLSRRLE